MHAVHLPPRDLWRNALLAALAALALTVALLMAVPRIAADSGAPSAAPSPAPAVPQASQTQVPAESRWLEPLAAPAPLVQAAQAD